MLSLGRKIKSLSILAKNSWKIEIELFLQGAISQKNYSLSEIFLSGLYINSIWPDEWQSLFPSWQKFVAPSIWKLSQKTSPFSCLNVLVIYGVGNFKLLHSCPATNIGISFLGHWLFLVPLLIFYSMLNTFFGWIR